MLFMEIIAVFYENLVKQIIELCDKMKSLICCSR
jgi:hypothetical protein